jgi:hypothetical protein
MLDLGLEIFRSRFGILVGLSVLLWMPVRLAQPFIGLHRWAERGAEDASIGLAFGFLFKSLSTLVVSALVNAFVAMLVSAHVEARELPALEALRQAFSRTIALLLIAVLGGILTTAGFACLCIPGVFFAYKVYLAPVVCVVEGTGVAESLSRSFELTRERFLPWAGLIVVVTLLTFPLTSVAAAVDDPNVRELVIQQLGTSGALFDWAAVPFTSLFFGVATALHAVVATVWYFDCRARREGADLAARLQRLRAVAPAGAAS